MIDTIMMYINVSTNCVPGWMDLFITAPYTDMTWSAARFTQRSRRAQGHALSHSPPYIYQYIHANIRQIAAARLLTCDLRIS
jgi:hypothetical protein